MAVGSRSRSEVPEVRQADGAADGEAGGSCWTAFLGVYGVSVVSGEAGGGVVTDDTLGLGKRFGRMTGALIVALCVEAGSRKSMYLKTGWL